MIEWGLKQLKSAGNVDVEELQKCEKEFEACKQDVGTST
jgi:hypothetical protein